MILPAYQSPAFVLASVFIAVLTAFVSIETSSRIRYATGDRRLIWLAISSVCLGGGIWSMHFVAMLGYVLPIPVGYNIALTALSLVVPIAVASVGFHFASKGPELTWRRTVVIGTIYGMAIVAMHYTGMAAMRMEAVMDWDVAYVVASIAVAVIASTAAIRSAFTNMNFLPAIAGSLLMGMAISGMHYTAMCAVTIVGAPGVDLPELSVSLTRQEMGLGVTLVAFAVLMMGTMAAAWDRRRSGRG